MGFLFSGAFFLPRLGNAINVCADAQTSICDVP
jgi:hypothetical protein